MSSPSHRHLNHRFDGAVGGELVLSVFGCANAMPVIDSGWLACGQTTYAIACGGDA